MAKLDSEYIERMEDVLNTLAKPLNSKEPVVALDERPVHLHGSARPDVPMAPGRPRRQDYEYVRRVAANVFCVVELKAGRHLTHATKNRKGPRFAAAMKRIADAYPRARTIHIIMDNLSTHREKSLTDRWGFKYGRQLWSRFTVHYTPKARQLAEPRRNRTERVVTRILGTQPLSGTGHVPETDDRLEPEDRS